jgi:hypothetical protein
VKHPENLKYILRTCSPIFLHCRKSRNISSETTPATCCTYSNRVVMNAQKSPRESISGIDRSASLPYSLQKLNRKNRAWFVLNFERPFSAPHRSERFGRQGAMAYSMAT